MRSVCQGSACLMSCLHRTTTVIALCCGQKETLHATTHLLLLLLLSCVIVGGGCTPAARTARLSPSICKRQHSSTQRVGVPCTTLLGAQDKT